MIWFFLMGMIAGAVGVVMFIHWYASRHAVVVRMTEDEFKKELKELEEKEKHTHE